MWTIWTISSVMWLVKQSEIIPQSSPFWLRWCGCHSQIGGLVLPTVYPLSQAPDRGSRSEIQPTQTPPLAMSWGMPKRTRFFHAVLIRVPKPHVEPMRKWSRCVGQGEPVDVMRAAELVRSGAQTRNRWWNLFFCPRWINFEGTGTSRTQRLGLDSRSSLE